MTLDRRLMWVAVGLLLAALAIAFLLSARLAFLNFFYLPILVVAYWGGHRAATLLAVLSVLFVAFLAVAVPEQFSLQEGSTAGTPAWLHLFVWSCFIILTAYVSGSLLERARDRTSAAVSGDPARTLYNIGTLAIIKGYLRHDQVLKILQIQKKSPNRRFGELAVGLRLLTPEQVDELLRLQQEKRSVTSSEIAMAKLELAKARQPQMGEQPR